MKPIVHSTYGENYNFEFDKSVEIYIDLFPNKTKDVDIRILIVMEPDIISRISDQVILRQDEFDYIFTFDGKIISNCKNSIVFEFGTKWVDYINYSYPNKNFSISTICGYKQISKNHLLRKKLWYKQEKITNPTDFYISQHGGVDNIKNNKQLQESKLPLFDSMFHVCIENVSQDYYFSEKLIDCFLCKSMPIYVGCNNLESYFNVEGMFLANDINQLIDICNTLTENDYLSRLDIIEENYQKAIYWSDYNTRLEKKIKELI